MPPPAACQLLTAIDDGEKAAAVLLDHDYAAQQKFDGKRILLHVDRRSVTAHNRDGLTCSVTPQIAEQAKALFPLAPLTLDGEWIREAKSFHAFDLLELGGIDTRALPFKTRQAHLLQTLTTIKLPSVHAARTEFANDGKLTLLQQIHAAYLEGVVFKRIDSPYKVGRQPDQYKYRFTAVSSFVIIKRNEKESVQIGLYDSKGTLVNCGDVKIRNSRFKLTEGMIIDVRYAHAFRDSQKVYHPRMISIRDDLATEACTLTQLRYKGTNSVIF